MKHSLKPTVVISLDLELSWGSFDHEYGPDLLERARWTHDHGVPAILHHLCRNRLSATWAVVGFVALDRLPTDVPLDEVHYPHFPHPWLRYVPCELTEAEAPEWFGASLVRQIRAAEPKQELAFHSLSHVVFGDHGTSRTRARQEFMECAAIARTLGCQPDSFVFPRNSVGYLDELRQSGFRCYRGPDLLPIDLPGAKGRSISALIADLLALRPRTVLPSLHDGLVEIPGSLMIRHAGGWRQQIPDRFRIRRLRAGLRRVSDEGGLFHVWLHPENLYDGHPRLEQVLATFLDELGVAVANEQVRCVTMGELAQEMLGRQRPTETPMSRELTGAVSQ